MKTYPITLTEDFNSLVIGELKLEDDYNENFSEGLTTLTYCFITNDGEKDLIGISLTMAPQMCGCKCKRKN